VGSTTGEDGRFSGAFATKSYKNALSFFAMTVCLSFLRVKPRDLLNRLIKFDIGRGLLKVVKSDGSNGARYANARVRFCARKCVRLDCAVTQPDLS
jgi:hypothetical protein